jgi:transcriptional regulator with PAS, ATPase and Fis domain
MLMSYSWPGNIRELQQAIGIARALVGPDDEIRREHLPPEIADLVKSKTQDDDALREDSASRELAECRRLLETAGFNLSVVARRLGIARSTLYRRLQRLESSTSLRSPNSEV